MKNSKKRKPTPQTSTSISNSWLTNLINPRRSKLPIRREAELPDGEVVAAEGDVAAGGEEIAGGAEDNDALIAAEDEEMAEDEEIRAAEESSDDDSVEEDDCPVINEDIQGYREEEAQFQEEEEDDLVDVEICPNLESHFGDDVCEDGPANGDDNSDDSGDDYWDDEKIPDPLSESDNDEETGFTYREPSNEELLCLYKTFNNADEFKYALLRYSLKTQYDIKMYKSSADRLGAKCTQYIEEKCPWRVYCSFEKRKRKLMVKVFHNEHVCVRSGYTKLLTSGTIAQLFEERLRMKHKIKSREMVDEIKREYNMIVTVHQCMRAKKLCFQKRKASHASHFARIFDYQEEIRTSNPGSTMEIETFPGPVPGSLQRFYRLYICFEALKTSWKQSCRPILGLDACFMKWDVKGQMLAAIGRDGDNRIFPIAWAVVEVEDISNWLWFVQLLKKDLSLEDGADITIISDKHIGLLNAVHNELSKAKHRMCYRHVLENWKKTNKDIELERLFWKIARSYTSQAFADNLEAMKKYNQGAYDSLQYTQPSTWTRAFFKIGSCCNDNLNNLSESFNRSIRESRRKPLLDFLTEVRRACMERNAKRTILTNRWKKRFTPRADKEIELNRQKAKDCMRYMTTGNLHEIDYHDVAYCVDMDKKTCGCGYWQLNGIPCMHAMCVITTTRLDLNDYVSDYYLTSTWRQLYVKGMKPVQGIKLWRRTGRLPVLPPPSRFNRGRPHGHARRKGPQESSSNPSKLTRHARVGTCSNCKKEGHNKTRCSNPPAAPQERRPRGRPRKDQSLSSQPSQASQSRM